MIRIPWFQMENDGILGMLNRIVIPKVFQLWRRCLQPGDGLKVHFEHHEVVRGLIVVKVTWNSCSIMNSMLKWWFLHDSDVTLCVWYGNHGFYQEIIRISWFRMENDGILEMLNSIVIPYVFNCGGGVCSQAAASKCILSTVKCSAGLFR